MSRKITVGLALLTAVLFLVVASAGAATIEINPKAPKAGAKVEFKGKIDPGQATAMNRLECLQHQSSFLL